MNTNRRTALAYVLGLLLLGTLSTVAPSDAQSCEELIFRITQGGYEQSSLGFQPMPIQANQEGHVRAYWRSNSQAPYTLAVRYGHPTQFGYRGEDAIKVRQHFRINPQQPQQVQRGKVTFQAVRPGTTTIGFQITGSKNGSVFPGIPQRCRSGVLTIQVQAPQQNQGNQGNQGNSGQGNQGNYGQGQPPGNQGYDYGNQNNVPFIGGRYSSEFGDVYLNQDGKRVWGTYTHQSGQIEGTFDGQVLRGIWKQGPSYRAPNDSGDIELRFNNGQFTGVWRYGNQGPWEGNWNGSWLGR